MLSPLMPGGLLLASFLPAGLSATSPLQPPLARSGTGAAFNASRGSSPHVRGGAAGPSPHKQPNHNQQHSSPGAARKGKGSADPGAR